MEEFGSSYSLTSGIYSVQIGILNCVGPIAAAFVKTFGSRNTVVLGSLIAATGFITSGLAQNIATLYMTAGFYAGNFCPEK